MDKPAAAERPPGGLWWWSYSGMTAQMRPRMLSWVRFDDYDRIAKKLARLERAGAPSHVIDMLADVRKYVVIAHDAAEAAHDDPNGLGFMEHAHYERMKDTKRLIALIDSILQNRG